MAKRWNSFTWLEFLNTLHLQVICLVQTRPKAWVRIEPPGCTGSWCRTTCPRVRDSVLVLRGLTPPPSPPLQSSWVRSGSGYWQSCSPGRGRSVHSLTPQTGTPEEREATWKTVLAAVSLTFTPREEISFNETQFNTEKKNKKKPYSIIKNLTWQYREVIVFNRASADGVNLT